MNPDLLRQPEREALDNAAGRLAANGLTFERDLSFPKPDEPPRPFKFRLRPDVASVSLFADAPEEPLSDVLRQTLARKVLVEKARRRERAEAEKRREQKPVKKRQSVAPVDAETLLKKAAAKVRTPAQPQRRGFSFSSWQTSNKRAPPPKATAKRKAQEQLERASRPAYAVAVQVQEGPHERRAARGDARGRAGLILGFLRMVRSLECGVGLGLRGWEGGHPERVR